jgi:transposase
VGVSPGTVDNVLSRATRAGLQGWASVDGLSEDELEAVLYQRAQVPVPEGQRPEPDCAWIHRELRRPGVTLDLLHHEYLEQHPNGLRYSAFCERYREFRERRRMSMRQHHVAGDKMFVDYSGKKPHYVDAQSGEIVEVELYVAVLGASNYTFVEATHTQTVPDFCASNARALEAFGGVPRAIVPDQLKSAVVQSDRYEPGVQRTFEEFGRHFATTILPARPRSPRDKAKVEAGVLVAQRWILARMRNETFHSLGELNARIRELTLGLNRRVMRHYKASRAELFERLDRPALGVLPLDAFECATWKKVRLNLDYHAVIDDHFYSGPFTLAHQHLWARVTPTTVELRHGSGWNFLHLRSYVKGGHTTHKGHMPASHQKHAEWTPSRILAWALSVGPATAKLAETILAAHPHPEWGYRSCLGLFRLAKRHGDSRAEAACARALAHGARSYRSVASILKHGLDQVPMADDAKPTCAFVDHENVRGSDYYH